MTNQTIPPCPVCGAQPELIIGPFGTVFGCKKCDIAAPRRDRRELLVRDVLGRACRELGIETVEQLKAKMQPDPRVAELDKLGVRSVDDLHRLMRLGYCAKKAYRSKRILARESDVEWFESIAAQRGEE